MSGVEAFPIHKLPFDLLVLVFESYVHHGSDGDPSALLAVCHEWHEAVNTLPCLWTRIEISTPVDNIHSTSFNIRKRLERSKDCGLTISISLNIGFPKPKNTRPSLLAPHVETKNIFEVLLGVEGQAMRRWEDVTIREMGHSIYVDLENALYSKLRYPTPRLRKLRMVGVTCLDHEMFSDAPQLSEINLTKCLVPKLVGGACSLNLKSEVGAREDIC